MSLLAINWGTIGIQAAYLIMSLSLLVLLHELGHFIPAKIFKCRVEKFYLFFDPYFSLVKKKIGETVYGIGWLPLGGYVKIAGMVDESMDKEQLKQPPQSWEFRSKPAWQRLIIMIGGVTVNVLLAFVIYAFILMVWGEGKVENSSLKYGIEVQDSLMYKLGFRDGDILVGVDGKRVENFNDYIPQLANANKYATIRRNGQEINLNLPPNFIDQLASRKKESSFLAPRFPFIIGADTGFAARHGLKKWDKVVMVDSVVTPFVGEVETALQKKKNSTAWVTLQRGDSTIRSEWAVDSAGLLGGGLIIIGKPATLDSIGIVKYQLKKYGFFEAFPAGVKMTFDKLGWYVGQFKKILSPETGAYKHVGGFASMGSIFPQKWGDWESFWRITALFSIILAFMNLLPIPALDGGHVVFTLYEMITRRKPGEKFLEYAQIVGMVLLLALMLFANGNDLYHRIFGK
jgi:regulator of sigma E protease